MQIPLLDNLFERLSYYRDKYIEIFNSLDYEIKVIMISLSALLLVSFALLIGKNRKLNENNYRVELFNTVTKRMDPSNGLDKTLDDLLDIASQIIVAQTYAVYFLDLKNDKYTLKALKDTSVDTDGIYPSYDGLAPYKKELFRPPLVFIAKYDHQKGVQFIEDGNVSLVLLPVVGNSCILKIGPVSKPSRKEKLLLENLAALSEKCIYPLIESEKWHKQIEIHNKSDFAAKSISNIIFDYRNMLNNILNVTLKTMGASGAVYFLENSGKREAICPANIDVKLKELFSSNLSLFDFLDAMLGKRSIVVHEKGDPDFYKLPDYLSSIDIQVFTVTRVKSEFGRCIGMLWCTNSSMIRNYRMNALEIINRIISSLLDYHVTFASFSSRTFEMLKNLAQVLDNLSPYTTGRSELTARYSAILAFQLGLDKTRVKEIALAGSLSNIGIIGISEDIFLKRGKYVKSEYDLMKLHCEIGASIIEATTGNRNIAMYVRQHHERIDGNGYPLGLTGDEISTGAKIIAVVQTFLAKINGRENRPPLEFQQAIEMMKSASGSQLDEKIVGILVNWFVSKQNEAAYSDTPLGSCWEMQCPPEEVCGKCPNYGITGLKCWESSQNNCSEHGDTCDTCYVYTEYQSRKAGAQNTKEEAATGYNKG